MAPQDETLAQRLIAKIFADRYRAGMREVPFPRDDIVAAAEALGEARPTNIGDIVYSLRYRMDLPPSLREEAPSGREWAIFPGGNAAYVLRLVPVNLIKPRDGEITIERERHYRLVEPDDLSLAELRSYRGASESAPR